MSYPIGVGVAPQYCGLPRQGQDWQPGDLDETRGFASPPRDGFAREDAAEPHPHRV